MTKKLIILVLLAACGKESDLAKMQTASPAVEPRDCEALNGTYKNADSEVQTVYIRNCEINIESFIPHLNLQTNHYATIETTHPMVGHAIVTTTKLVGFDSDQIKWREGTHDCTFSLIDEKLKFVCKTLFGGSAYPRVSR